MYDVPTTAYITMYAVDDTNVSGRTKCNKILLTSVKYLQRVTGLNSFPVVVVMLKFV